MTRQPPALTVNGELARCVRAWRHRMARDAPRYPGAPRRRERVTQEEMAEATGVSVVWYSKLERGVRANYSGSFLDAVAGALKLDEDERVLLHLLAAGRAPSPPAAGPAMVAPDHSLRQLVSGQRWPAYVLNRYCRIVLHNKPCEAYFPWLREDPSYPRWLLTSADARQRLVDWANDWAAPLLAQLRMARATHPDDARMTALIDTCVSASPETRRLWDGYAGHKDLLRSRRAIRLPGSHHATTVNVVTLTEPKPNELRVVMLIPAAEPL